MRQRVHQMARTCNERTHKGWSRSPGTGPLQSVGQQEAVRCARLGPSQRVGIRVKDAPAGQSRPATQRTPAGRRLRPRRQRWRWWSAARRRRGLQRGSRTPSSALKASPIAMQQSSAPETRNGAAVAAATAAVLAFGRAAVGRTTLRGRARKLAARTSPAYCAPWHARPQPALTCSRSSRRCRGAQASSWTHRATAAERRATLLLATRRAGSTSAAEADSMAAM